MRNYFAIFRKIIIFASWYSAICWICSHTLRGCVDWNIDRNNTVLTRNKSHPSWVCGLKLLKFLAFYLVVPSHTLRGCVDWNSWCVCILTSNYCHTLRGCVDWNNSRVLSYILVESHTLRGCVDWNYPLKNVPSKKWSHTLRGCVDWNQSSAVKRLMMVVSHPSWVCGLKPINAAGTHGVKPVTPFVGVWIETNIRASRIRTTSHTLRGCVDWNNTCDGLFKRIFVTPFVGVWIETSKR